MSIDNLQQFNGFNGFNNQIKKEIVQAFGLDALRSVVHKGIMNNDYLNAQDINQVAGSSSRLSQFGLPIFDEVIFGDPISGIIYHNEFGVPITLPPLVLDIALFDVTQSKNIVKTGIVGKSGTIKEFIGQNDYSINIRGVLVSPYMDGNPLTDVQGNDGKAKLLIDYCNANIPIPVTSNWLQSFGDPDGNGTNTINYIVIEEFNFIQNEGNRNVIPFTIKASSDYPASYYYLNATT